MCFFSPQADDRKAKLLDSYDFQRFLSDERDLMSWINSMMALVRSDELAKDVTGAEALLERHQVRALDYQPLKPLCVQVVLERYGQIGLL
jgi:hypothetical protein